MHFLCAVQAASRGYTECIKVLLQSGAGINLTDSSNRTALHLVYFNWHIFKVLFLSGSLCNHTISWRYVCSSWRRRCNETTFIFVVFGFLPLLFWVSCHMTLFYKGNSTIQWKMNKQYVLNNVLNKKIFNANCIAMAWYVINLSRLGGFIAIKPGKCNQLS